eukprot:TRINITY_DN5358_c0_g1_i5.p3 TRINITY_DN5358_c0_g1~~TRINITY_DN5358_c0_g1_i5.p3  ORF type:complete len:112 (+),score=26.59 TRINITY_DN5358_c0_g1_i5:688-1023(+)
MTEIEIEGKLVHHAPDSWRGEEVLLIFQGTEPNGLALRGSDLYISDISKLYRIPDVEEQIAQAKAKHPDQQDLHAAMRIETLPVTFPEDRLHGWRYISFGPDDRYFGADLL